MFGDVVLVKTTLDSLGNDNDHFDNDSDEEEYQKNKRLKAETGGVDKAQKYAHSFKAIKEKIDATPLTTKRQRAAKRNKSQTHLDNRNAKGKKSFVDGKGKKTGLDASSLTVKAVKTANKSVGKKGRSSNAKKK